MNRTVHVGICFGVLLCTFITRPAVQAGTILQGAANNFVAFEAEDNVTIIPGTPTSWVITNDVTTSGSQALFAAGANGTVTPSSFATYQIKFRMPGNYKIFFRWRAHSSYTDADPNAANSYFAPLIFNASTNLADYHVSTVNNMRVRPESNVYGLGTETELLTVTQAQVDAGALRFVVGTREAGMLIERFVLTLDSALTDAQFNALENSDTDVFVQPSGVNYVAFEAESPKVSLIPGTPTSWVITNDVTPSGSQALFAAGANGTVTPSSFATYQIKFRTPGNYKIFFRWRAHSSYTDADPNAANSYFAPLIFNASTNLADYHVSTVNNMRVRPESNVYGLGTETELLTVTQAQIDVGLPLRFVAGTREAGMLIERFVLTLDSALTEAQFNALENTGAGARPIITRVAGSGALTEVKVSFSKTLEPLTVDSTAFTISGGVTVLDAILDPITMKDVTLITSTQAQGALYTLTVNEITDAVGNLIAPNTTTNFYAWKQVFGFTRRELYFAIAGADVNSLISSPKFPNSPDQVDVVLGLASVNIPRAGNYGVRLSGYFTPTVAGRYDFFMYNNNEARLLLSTNDSTNGLQTILTAPSTSTLAFNPAVFGSSPGQLQAGARYYIQVLLKQADDYDAFVNVTVRRQGDTTPVDSLPPLGNQVSVFVDPLTSLLNVSRQPASVTTTNGNRARFEATANSLGGPVFYQWQLNGTNIQGATRAAYYTPVLGTTNSGSQYRALIFGGGVATTSAVATVTVNAGAAPSLQPYLGMNFVGGAAGVGPAGTLLSNDVVGVVPQANYNNLTGGGGTNVALRDASGVLTPVTATYVGVAYATGTGEDTAENLLFQGYLHNTNTFVTVTLRNVPPGTYNLIAYSVGFNYNATYEQTVQLAGGAPYPSYIVRAEHAGTYAAAPSVFRRMSSTSAATRADGNYVMYDNISPDPAGTLVLTVTNESTFTGVNVNPALSGIQLVRVAATTSLPALTIQRSGTNITVGWTSAATGFVLESSPVIGSSTNWQIAPTAPNPITGAGSIVTSSSASGARFYRLRQ